MRKSKNKFYTLRVQIFASTNFRGTNFRGTYFRVFGTFHEIKFREIYKLLLLLKNFWNAKISSAKFTNWRFPCCRWASFFKICLTFSL